MIEYVKNVTATGTVLSDTSRIFSINLTSKAGVTSRVMFKDLTATKAVGSEKITILVPTGNMSHSFSDGGIRFYNGVHVSVPASIDGFISYG